MKVYARLADGGTRELDYAVLTAYEAIRCFQSEFPDARTACSGDDDMQVYARCESGAWDVDLRSEGGNISLREPRLRLV